MVVLLCLSILGFVQGSIDLSLYGNLDQCVAPNGAILSSGITVGDSGTNNSAFMIFYQETHRERGIYTFVPKIDEHSNMCKLRDNLRFFIDTSDLGNSVYRIVVTPFLDRDKRLSLRTRGSEKYIDTVRNIPPMDTSRSNLFLKLDPSNEIDRKGYIVGRVYVKPPESSRTNMEPSDFCLTFHNQSLHFDTCSDNSKAQTVRIHVQTENNTVGDNCLFTCSERRHGQIEGVNTPDSGMSNSRSPQDPDRVDGGSNDPLDHSNNNRNRNRHAGDDSNNNSLGLQERTKVGFFKDRAGNNRGSDHLDSDSGDGNSNRNNQQDDFDSNSPNSGMYNNGKGSSDRSPNHSISRPVREIAIVNEASVCAQFGDDGADVTQEIRDESSQISSPGSGGSCRAEEGSSDTRKDNIVTEIVDNIGNCVHDNVCKALLEDRNDIIGPENVFFSPENLKRTAACSVTHSGFIDAFDGCRALTRAHDCRENVQNMLKDVVSSQGLSAGSCIAGVQCNGGHCDCNRHAVPASTLSVIGNCVMSKMSDTEGKSRGEGGNTPSRGDSSNESNICPEQIVVQQCPSVSNSRGRSQIFVDGKLISGDKGRDLLDAVQNKFGDECPNTSVGDINSNGGNSSSEGNNSDRSDFVRNLLDRNRGNGDTLGFPNDGPNGNNGGQGKDMGNNGVSGNGDDSQSPNNPSNGNGVNHSNDGQHPENEGGNSPNRGGGENQNQSGGNGRDRWPDWRSRPSSPRERGDTDSILGQLDLADPLHNSTSFSRGRGSSNTNKSIHDVLNVIQGAPYHRVDVTLYSIHPNKIIREEIRSLTRFVIVPKEVTLSTTQVLTETRHVTCSHTLTAFKSIVTMQTHAVTPICVSTQATAVLNTLNPLVQVISNCPHTHMAMPVPVSAAPRAFPPIDTSRFISEYSDPEEYLKKIHVLDSGEDIVSENVFSNIIQNMQSAFRSIPSSDCLVVKQRKCPANPQ